MEINSAQSTYIRSYNSNSGRGRLPAYLQHQAHKNNQNLSASTTRQTSQIQANNSLSLQQIGIQQGQAQVVLSSTNSLTSSTVDSTYNKTINKKDGSSSRKNPFEATITQDLKAGSVNDDVQKTKTQETNSERSQKEVLQSTSSEQPQKKNKEIEDLKKRDKEVKIHEAQHKSIGGVYAQAPSYSYTTGPDGHQYITDGSVSISLSEEKNPADTIKKMEQVHSAALAPAEPSSADRNVAAEAIQIANRARQQLLHEEANENSLASNNGADNKKSDAISTINAAEESKDDTGLFKRDSSSSSPSSNSQLDISQFSRVISRRYQSSYQYSTAGSGVNVMR